jgi:cytochrome c
LRPADAAPETGGDVARGRERLDAFGCPACHTIPGVRLARGKVGPKLESLRERVYIAGVLPKAENMIWWIRHPQHEAGTRPPQRCLYAFPVMPEAWEPK